MNRTFASTTGMMDIEENKHTDSDAKISPTRDVVKEYRNVVKLNFRKRANGINVALRIMIHASFLAYVICAMWNWTYGSDDINWCHGHGLLLGITCLIYANILYNRCSSNVSLVTNWRNAANSKLPKTITRNLELFGCVSLLFTFVVYLAYDTAGNRYRLVPITGITSIILAGYLFSKHPSQVCWTIVFRGLTTQVLMALLSIRWSVGRQILACMGEHVETFLSFAYQGASFVYGKNLVYKEAILAFQCFSTLYFISCIVEILFYYGVLQRVFVKMGWALKFMVGTTVIESINCCASVFLGLAEAPILIKPYLKDLTISELQAVMLGGLSTVAGSVFAAYVSFGINPGHLLTASIMSAPAALSLSKLLYPETEISKTKIGNLSLGDNTKNEDGVIGAACHGAMNGIAIIHGIVANLIAFVSLFAFINAVIGWLGMLAGIAGLSLDVILSKAFIPIALAIGVDPKDSSYVARLIAIKATLTEFMAYEELGKLKKSNLISVRSETIATYALCSFSNPTSVGVSIAVLTSLCPEQRQNILKVAFRAYVGGIVTCFLTASIAGLLITDEHVTLSCGGSFNGTVSTC